MDSALPRTVDEFLTVVRERAAISAGSRLPQIVRCSDGSFAPVVSVRDWMVLLICSETEKQRRALEDERRAHNEVKAPV